MKLITQWDKSPSWGGRIADPWRTRMPVPRYLRHSPLRTMRERLWFVSRLQPTVQVTLNVARGRMGEPTGAAPTTVFLHQWLATRSVTLQTRHAAALPSTPLVMGALASIRPPSPAFRRSSTPAHIVLPARQRSESNEAGSSHRSAQPSMLLPRMQARAERMDTLTPPPPPQVVKSHPAPPQNAAPGARDSAGRWPSSEHQPPFEADPAAVRIPTQMPAFDTERLTEQVLRQLDRRLIASRERMGRI